MKLSRFSKFIIRNAGWVTLFGLALAIAGTCFSVSLYKNLRTDIEELLPSHSRSGEDLTALTDRIESFDYIVLLIYSKEVKGSRRFVDDLAVKLQAIPKDIAASVEYKIGDEMKFFRRRAPLYVEVPDLILLRDYIRDRIKWEMEMYSPFNIFPVGDKMKKPELSLDGMTKKYARKDSFDQYPDGYYATHDETKRAIMVYMTGKHSNIHRAIQLSDWVQKIVNGMDMKSYAPDLRVRYGGGVQDFIEEHHALIADLELSTVIVVVLVTIAMFLFYRDIVGTVSLVASLFMGTLWTFGVSYFAVGYLNANSAFLGSIVIGNGINFGIIVLARYVEERRRHRGLYRSIDTAMRATATATATAALAAGLSYGSLFLTRFRGFRQFGVIGFIGMLLCWISAFTLLPALLTVLGKRFPKTSKGSARLGGAFANYLANFVNRWPAPICLVSLVLTLAALAMFPRISPKIIQTDLSKLRNKESMIHGSGSLLPDQEDIFQRYLTETVILADSREDARKIAEKLRELKKVPANEIAVVKVFDDFVPPNQAQKIPIIMDIKKRLTPRIVKNMEPKERGWIRDFLGSEAMEVFTEKDLPPLVTKKFTEKNGALGRFVVVEPPLERQNDLAWDGSRLIRYIRTLREAADSIRPGTPVAGQLPISADMVESISKDGPRATLFAFLAVVVLVIVLFRDVKTIFRTLFALLLGVIWLFGLILAMGTKINFLNFIALPITFGIGVDYGVNIFQRYRLEKGRRIVDVIRNTGGAVILASMTTIIGYSSLIIAQNQAFVSFGTLAVLGELTCITAAVVALPAYLIFRGRRKNEGVVKNRENPPIGVPNPAE